ncbi:hypothetical protein EOD39_10161 [Acipenser ruthenus]|uniref:Cadherin domain-containing protein n=1 Tax=Acipenser ruthenus TaxID=7906 RepID=A0A662YVJ1_ACIRT|nr:hypothetical protein EOD39_10161 [Acipenser ruthenus]
MVVDSLVGETNFTFYAFARDNGDIAIKSDPAIVQIHVKKSQVDGIVSKSRKMRAVSEEMFYAVSVAEDMKVGDLIFIVPGLKFGKKWFEVISDADSPVRIERDSGKLYLARRLQSDTDVVVKIQNLKGIIKLRKSPLPKLRGPQYILSITATDDNASGGPTALSNYAQVIVGINDINNNKPVFREVMT